jgi:Protein of unknown function (DUF2934)
MKPAPATSTRLTTTNQTTGSASDLQEQVRRRAYELYEERGKVNGHDLADWLQAESEVRQQKSKAMAA